MPPRRDLLLCLALLAVAELETLLARDALTFALAIPFFTLALAWRRTHALQIAVAATTALLAASLIQNAEWNSIAAVGGWLLVGYSAGAWETRERSLLALAVLVPGVVVQDLIAHDGDAVFAVLTASGPWLAGRGVRARRLQAERLAELTERLRRERDSNAALAVTAERLSVARELHDSVAGRLNVMVMQAAAAEAAPEHAPAAVAAVQDAGREASAELADMLQLLGGGEGRQPQPRLDRIDDLVNFARSAGIDVQLEVSGARPLAPGLELSAYRIVQEALTNVVKHAPGSATAVRLIYDDGEPWSRTSISSSSSS